MGFDTWQDGAGRLILAKRADGLYAADTSVMSIPRQVGKTYLIGAIVFALCLIFPGLTVIWTAHRFKTARETFTSMKGMARRKAVAPHVARIVLGSGDESIQFRNGSRILFGARENGFGLGFTNVGVLVLDEAQRLTSKAMDDLVPTTNAALNPLILMTGTPPRPTDPGEIFTSLRLEALDGESEGTLYIEFSADRGADPLDRKQWAKANPSFPKRTSERAILRMRKNLSEDSFRREALGIWDEVSRHTAVVKASDWTEMSDVGPADGTKPDALAIDMSHGREISISACWVENESAHIEEVWAGVDFDAALEWVWKRAGRRMPVVVDSMSPAASFLPMLRARGMRVIQTGANDMAKACGTFLDKFEAGRLTHADQEAVNDALAGARKRPIGTAGGWGWDRRDETVNIAPIVSPTLALFGAFATTKPTKPANRGRSSSGRRATLL
ncbi:terminase [Nocardia wallacei]|uniref:terminase n=1 Tax=Nocardia wallacei TaxID=480035 RepID=UPI0024540DBE|nr:terminase [Nocardia wallacei]